MAAMNEAHGKVLDAPGDIREADDFVREVARQVGPALHGSQHHDTIPQSS